MTDPFASTPSGSTSDASTGRHPIVLRRTWSAALLLLSALVHLPSLLTSRPIDDDETYLAVMGRMLAHGDALYRGVVDRKPPLAIWAFRWLVPDSWSLRWVHIVAIALIALNGWVVAHIALRFGANGTTALTAAALSIIGTALLGHADAHSANFEIWGLVPATVAVWCVVKSPRALAWAALAGASVGIATNCKQPYVFTLLAVVVAVPKGSRLRAGTVAFSACAATTVGIAAMVGWNGYWRWVWLENGDYVKVSIITIGLVAVRQTVIFIALQWPIALGVVLRFRGRGDRDNADPRGATSHHQGSTAVLLAWTVAAFVGVASGLRFFGHYYQQLVAPLALLSAFGLAAWAHARKLILAATAWACVLFGLVLFPSLRGLEPAPAELARVIRSTTQPNDRVLIWGRLPDGAVRSHRITAGRFVHHAYLTGLWANADSTSPTIMSEEPYKSRWVEYLTDLGNDPPKLIVDATSIVDGWAKFPISVTPIHILLDSCYRRVTPIAGLPTYRLQTNRTCPSPIEPTPHG